MSVLAVLAAIGALGFSYSQGDDRGVPEKYKNIKNPYEANDESLYIGKTIYAKHCKSCHGKYGEGDGNQAEEPDTKVEDFTKGLLDNQSDGALFYKTWEGRDDMPAFKKKFDYEEDVWNGVNYLREIAE